MTRRCTSGVSHRLLALACALGSLAACGNAEEREHDSGSKPVDLSECTSRALPSYVFDAAYSDALGRIVVVDAGLELSLIDPSTLESVAIPFPAGATAGTIYVFLS